MFSSRQVLFVVAFLVACVSAGSKDLCTAGSDSECARFGANMCCAYIEYTFKNDQQQFYACASRPGIEYSNGQIYDKYGFSGTWQCAYAEGLKVGMVTVAALLASAFAF